MRLAASALVVLALGRAAHHSADALEMTARVHYPEKNSSIDFCGFSFEVHVAPADDPTITIARAPAVRRGEDLFVAQLSLDNQYLYGKVMLAVLASVEPGKIGGPECTIVCPGLGPQGGVVMSGAYTKSQALQQSNILDFWPDFACRNWISKEVSFASKAIGRRVNAIARMPAAQQENPLPRPSAMLPAIMFRLNPEWYWDGLPFAPSIEDYAVWHSLMVNGAMQDVVVIEVHIEGVDWKSWSNQPVFTTEKLHGECPRCKPELQFICDRWNASGASMFSGGDHDFGSAAAFFHELYFTVMPGVLAWLPAITDSRGHQGRNGTLQAAEAAPQQLAGGLMAGRPAVANASVDASITGSLRVGVWGYCIGGLGAWNAISTLPHLFNAAYLGSPAVDFDCGDSLSSVQNISASPPGAHKTASIGGGEQLRPLIYIDSGAEEGDLMDRQTLLLYRMLQGQGLVPGKDLFYSRATFGTHQSRMMLRRAMKGMLVMFGSGSSSEASAGPLASPGIVSGMDIADLIREPGVYLPSIPSADRRQDESYATIFAASCLSFLVGLATMRLAKGTSRPGSAAEAPLLHA